jgi:hypothetical protein
MMGNAQRTRGNTCSGGGRFALPPVEFIQIRRFSGSDPWGAPCAEIRQNRARCRLRALFYFSGAMDKPIWPRRGIYYDPASR